MSRHFIGEPIPPPLPSPSLPLPLRYMFYDGVWPQVSGLLEDWDRSIGSARPKKPSEVESLEQQTHAPSTPKHKGGKGKKEVGMYTHTHARTHTHTHTRTHTHTHTHTHTYVHMHMYTHYRAGSLQCACIQKPDERALLTSGSRSSLLVVPTSPLTEENRKGLGVPVLTVGAGQSREDVGREIADQLPPLTEVSLRGGSSGVLVRCARQVCSSGVLVRCARQVCSSGVLVRCARQVCSSGVLVRCARQVCSSGAVGPHVCS